MLYEGLFQVDFNDNACSSIVAFPPTRSSNSHFQTPDTNWVNKLPDYPIPKEVQKDIDLQNRLNNFKPWLLRENYKERLQLLLWVEEAQQNKNIRLVCKKFELNVLVNTIFEM